MPSQLQQAQAFKQLHERPGCFVIPNPWDAGSAKALAALGFEALATTSAGLAFSLGRQDGAGLISREETLSNAKAIIAATSLPVAADLENGFGDTPQECAQTIILAAQAGLVGGSIEDASGQPEAPIYPLELAVERIQAAVEAAHAQHFPFTLCARAENFLHGRIDLADTIRRLQAYAEAGADVLYAPGLRSREEISSVVRALAPKPINVVMGLGTATFTVSELAELGVKRISLGSALARAAFGAFLRAAEEVREHGSFTFATQAEPFARINALFKPQP